MRLRHFDLNLLVALDALLDTKSVTRASERLCIGASATSSALGRLREHFGDDLLKQIGRKMELTPLAQSLVQPVREIILRTQSTLERRAAFDPRKEGRHFVFNASDYVSTVLMPSLLRHVQTQAPGMTVDMLSLGDNALELLDRGEVDFAIYPDRYASDKHPSLELFEESYSCVVWTGNKFVGDQMTFEQYIDLGHVAARFGDTRVVSFEGWFLSTFGARRRVEVTASSFNALPYLVVGTTRIATMHTRLAMLYSKQLPLRLMKPPVDIPALKMVLQWHAINEDDPAHAWMREQIAAMARDHLR